MWWQFVRTVFQIQLALEAGSLRFWRFYGLTRYVCGTSKIITFWKAISCVTRLVPIKDASNSPQFSEDLLPNPQIADPTMIWVLCPQVGAVLAAKRGKVEHHNFIARSCLVQKVQAFLFGVYCTCSPCACTVFLQGFWTALFPGLNDCSVYIFNNFKNMN